MDSSSLEPILRQSRPSLWFITPGLSRLPPDGLRSGPLTAASSNGKEGQPGLPPSKLPIVVTTVFGDTESGIRIICIHCNVGWDPH